MNAVKKRIACDRCGGDLVKIGFVDREPKRIVYECISCRIELKDCVDCKKPRSRWGNHSLCIECHTHWRWNM